MCKLLSRAKARATRDGICSERHFSLGLVVRLALKQFILGRTYFWTEAEIDMLGRYLIWTIDCCNRKTHPIGIRIFLNQPVFVAQCRNFGTVFNLEQKIDVTDFTVPKFLAFQ